jgi:hypothetical protein
VISRLSTDSFKPTEMCSRTFGRMDTSGGSTRVSAFGRMGVVVTYQRYVKRTRVGDVQIPAGSFMLHQILNSGQFNGAGSRVFRQFIEQVVKPSGGDLYLTVRKDNKTACDFYERQGMKVAGTVDWKNGTIPGLVYRLHEHGTGSAQVLRTHHP